MGTDSEDALKGLFDDLDVNSAKLGPTVAKRNEKLVKLLDEDLIRYRTIYDLPNHVLRYREFIDVLTQFTPNGLAVLELDAHVSRLLLKPTNLRADVA